MTWTPRHPESADARLDAGPRDCGDGLLLLVRKHLDPLLRGQLLEVSSTAATVEDDLPAWCNATGNPIVSAVRDGERRSYMICKGALAERHGRRTPALPKPRGFKSWTPEGVAYPTPAAAPPVPLLSVMSVGSWPRPRWMRRAIHDRLEGRLSEGEFQEAGDDSVRLAVAAQLRAGADVLTDGEQRRDNYASFVGGRLDHCQLVPIGDLLPLVSNPRAFERELRALDVPMEAIRQPIVLGRLCRSRPIAGHELAFLRELTDRPTKVALPGPYLLTRLLSIDCLRQPVYPSRDSLADDVVSVLRREMFSLLAGCASLVQFDEPLLTEVAFGRPIHDRVFLCGPQGRRDRPDEELAYAGQLLNRVVADAPRDRVGLHVCRGHWSHTDRAHHIGDYTPLVPLLRTLNVGLISLEMSAPRPGEFAALRQLPDTMRVGVGVVDPRLPDVESVADVFARADASVTLFGPERVVLQPECGFAPFADNPSATAATAEAKLAVLSQVAALLRKRHARRYETAPLTAQSPGP